MGGLVGPVSAVVGMETFTPRVSILVLFDHTLKMSTMFSEVLTPVPRHVYSPPQVFILRILPLAGRLHGAYIADALVRLRRLGPW